MWSAEIIANYCKNCDRFKNLRHNSDCRFILENGILTLTCVMLMGLNRNIAYLWTVVFADGGCVRMTTLTAPYFNTLCTVRAKALVVNLHIFPDTILHKLRPSK